MYEAGSHCLAVLCSPHPKSSGQGHLCDTGRYPSKVLIQATESDPQWSKFSQPQQTDTLYKILDSCQNYGVTEKKSWVSIKSAVIQGLFSFSGSQLPSTL